MGDFSRNDITGKTPGVVKFDSLGTKVLKIKTGQLRSSAKSVKIGL